METSRPTLDVTNLDSPSKLQRARAKIMKKRYPKVAHEQRSLIRHILSRWRRIQRRMDPEYSPDDPHPYEYTYVFYCLEDGCEVDK